MGTITVTKSTKQAKSTPLFILSDSTGELAIHQTFTMLSQFPQGTFKVRLFNFLERPEVWDSALELSRKHKAIVLHSTRDSHKKKAGNRGPS